MKKTLSILLASLLVVFTLTACGGDRKDSNAGTNGGNAATTPNGSGNAGGSGLDGGADANGPGEQEDGTITGGEAGDHIPGDDALTGGAGTDTGTGTAAQQSSRSGASYDQMLRNARVHDSDGMLWDHENAVTPGSAY